MEISKPMTDRQKKADNSRDLQSENYLYELTDPYKKDKIDLQANS